MTRPEYKGAPRVFVIVDNGSDHRGKAAIDRLRSAHPNAIMIHTPVHASWLNQVEIFFSVIQKKVVLPNDFASLEQLSETLLDFIRRYNQTAKPFQLEIHRRRPRRPAPPHQRTRQTSHQAENHPHDSSVRTLNELTEAPTKEGRHPER